MILSQLLRIDQLQVPKGDEEVRAKRKAVVGTFIVLCSSSFAVIVLRSLSSVSRRSPLFFFVFVLYNVFNSFNFAFAFRGALLLQHFSFFRMNDFSLFYYALPLILCYFPCSLPEYIQARVTVCSISRKHTGSRYKVSLFIFQLSNLARASEGERGRARSSERARVSQKCSTWCLGISRVFHCPPFFFNTRSFSRLGFACSQARDCRFFRFQPYHLHE